MSLPGMGPIKAVIIIKMKPSDLKPYRIKKLLALAKLFSVAF
jgi:hypothetical protein